MLHDDTVKNHAAPPEQLEADRSLTARSSADVQSMPANCDIHKSIGRRGPYYVKAARIGGFIYGPRRVYDSYCPIQTVCIAQLPVATVSVTAVFADAQFTLQYTSRAIRIRLTNPPCIHSFIHVILLQQSAVTSSSNSH